MINTIENQALILVTVEMYIILSSLGKVQVDIPRDRKRQFEATVVYKYSQYHKLVELLIEFSKK